MKKSEIINIFEKYLNKYQIEKLLIKNTGLTKNQLFFCEEIEISEKLINEIIKSLENNIPFEYIINEAEFYSLNFYVDNRVLIPRNDTEIMVGETLKEINKYEKVEYIDIWTGSSCIAISILKNIEKNKIIKSVAIDISDDAIEVSKINIKNHKIKNIENLKSDLLNSYKDEKNHKIITANLPYIKNNDFQNMSISTINHEPNIALYWWENTWFELYEKLIEQCINIKNITLFIEIWFDQSDYSKKYLKKKWLDFIVYKDNCWIDRCIKINI
jgi:release factor glutamine methyltransferase